MRDTIEQVHPVIMGDAAGFNWGAMKNSERRVARRTAAPKSMDEASSRHPDIDDAIERSESDHDAGSIGVPRGLEGVRKRPGIWSEPIPTGE